VGKGHRLRVYENEVSRDSSVGIALGYGLDDRDSRVVLGPTQPPIQWVPGALSQGIKRPGREADHSPPSSARCQRMTGAVPPFLQYAFMAWCSVKAQAQLYL
jgi:hypothetical protein